MTEPCRACHGANRAIRALGEEPDHRNGIGIRRIDLAAVLASVEEARRHPELRRPRPTGNGKGHA